MPSVINAEGTTLVEYRDTQSIHSGMYFSSLGPELFIDFSKHETEVYVNHCSIIKPVVKFGFKKKLDILGEYEEWLLYFALYKTALIELARLKGSA
jgi:hypothetical protein